MKIREESHPMTMNFAYSIDQIRTLLLFAAKVWWDLKRFSTFAELLCQTIIWISYISKDLLTKLAKLTSGLHLV